MFKYLIITLFFSSFKVCSFNDYEQLYYSDDQLLEITIREQNEHQEKYFQDQNLYKKKSFSKKNTTSKTKTSYPQNYYVTVYDYLLNKPFKTNITSKYSNLTDEDSIKKEFSRRFKFINGKIIDTYYGNLTVQTNKMTEKQLMSNTYTLKRGIRFAGFDDKFNPKQVIAAKKTLESIFCAYCSASIENYTSDPCYASSSIPYQKCFKEELCYLHLEHDRITRGCIKPTNIKTTFACNCFLCNDKPIDHIYSYDSIKTWKYHNEMLNINSQECELPICYSCETRGVDEKKDQICRNGKGAERINCTGLCFTTINNYLNYVKRGCIAKPFYNTYSQYCMSSFCNRDPIQLPEEVYSQRKYENIINDDRGIKRQMRDSKKNLSEKLLLLIETVANSSRRLYTTNVLIFNLAFSIRFKML